MAVDTVLIIRALFGRKSGFVGYMRFCYRILFYLNKYEYVKVKPLGIYYDNKLLEDPHYHITDFYAAEGMIIRHKDISKIKKIVKGAAFKKDIIKSALIRDNS
jgi:hypothetical protein